MLLHDTYSTVVDYMKENFTKVKDSNNNAENANNNENENVKEIDEFKYSELLEGQYIVRSFYLINFNDKIKKIKCDFSATDKKDEENNENIDNNKM